MLHIVKSQTSVSVVSNYSHSDDVILLIEDAVYCANPMHKDYNHLENKNIYCLAEDVEARGLTALLSDSIHTVNYRGFVELTARYTPSMTWN